MIEILNQMNHWHWIALGLVLLSGELLGTAGYLLWVGISAILVGLLKLTLPIGWEMQWVSFASFSLATTWLWWRYQHRQDAESDQGRDLNQREKQLIGQVTRIDESIPAGKCRIKLGDTTWSAFSHQAIEAGRLVKIVQVDGIILTIEPTE